MNHEGDVRGEGARTGFGEDHPLGYIFLRQFYLLSYYRLEDRPILSEDDLLLLLHSECGVNAVQEMIVRTPASTFAGDEGFGSANSDTTDSNMLSTD